MPSAAEGAAIYTLDASVHVSALNPADPNSDTSQALLALLYECRKPLISPTLLVVEVAAAVARALGDSERGANMAAAIRDLPGQILVPLDRGLADRAAWLAASRRLRGADAVYAAVAQRYGAVLVTFDRQQLERLPPAVPTVQPADLLRDLQAL